MRSVGGRRSGVSRWNSMKPVVLPIGGDSFGDGLLRDNTRQAKARTTGDAQHPLVFVREDLHEFGQHLVPVIEDPARARTAGDFGVSGDPLEQQLLVFGIGDRLEVDSRLVAPLLFE